MQQVSKEQFFQVLMAEKRDVISHCQFIRPGLYVSKFSYRYGELFGINETDFSTYPATETYKLAS